MKISGSHVVDQPVEAVWDALLDPQVLVATIPGCERLESTGVHSYAMTVSAGVAAIKGTYDGSCALSDLVERKALTMKLNGAGAPGTVDATVDVRFSSPSPGTTEIAYEADAVVGGMVGGVGQRMLTSVSKRMAGEFFGNVERAIASPPVPAAPSASPSPASSSEPAPTGAVFTAPAAAPASRDDFVRGVAVGAGLVLLGVLAGAVLGRRR